MITLSLLNPVNNVPIRNWTFAHNQTIRVGRSTNNEVVVYSAVVSRRHLEIRRSDSSWEIVNLGTNGTYIDGKPIDQAIASDGTIVCLAGSGPKIKITLENGSLSSTEQNSAVTRSKKPINQTMVVSDPTQILSSEPETEEINVSEEASKS